MCVHACMRLLSNFKSADLPKVSFIMSPGIPEENSAKSLPYDRMQGYESDIQLSKLFIMEITKRGMKFETAEVTTPSLIQHLNQTQATVLPTATIFFIFAREVQYLVCRNKAALIKLAFFLKVYL